MLSPARFCTTKIHLGHRPEFHIALFNLADVNEVTSAGSVRIYCSARREIAPGTSGHGGRSKELGIVDRILHSVEPYLWLFWWEERHDECLKIS